MAYGNRVDWSTRRAQVEELVLRHERERVPFHDGVRAHVELMRVQLSILLEGIVPQSAKTKKHFVSEVRLNGRDGDATSTVEPAAATAR